MRPLASDHLLLGRMALARTPGALAATRQEATDRQWRGQPRQGHMGPTRQTGSDGGARGPSWVEGMSSSGGRQHQGQLLTASLLQSLLARAAHHSAAPPLGGGIGAPAHPAPLGAFLRGRSARRQVAQDPSSTPQAEPLAHPAPVTGPAWSLAASPQPLTLPQRLHCGTEG